MDVGGCWSTPLLRPRFYVGLSLVVLTICSANAIAQYLNLSEVGYIVLHSKEGLIESLGAASCFLATILLLAAACWPRRRGELSAEPIVRKRYLLIPLMILALVTMLEELGWGARVLAWYFPGLGVREEFRLSEFLRPRTTRTSPVRLYWFAALFCWGALLPVLSRFVSSMGKGLERVGVPTPSFRLSLVWLSASLLMTVMRVAPERFWVTGGQAAEAAEAVFQLLLGAWAYEEYVRAWRPGSKLAGATTWRWALRLAALLALGSMVMDVAFRTGPWARGHRLAVNAMKEEEPAARIDGLRKSLEIYDNDWTHHALAQELDAQGRLEEAIAHYLKAARLARRLYPPGRSLPENRVQVSTYFWHLGQAYLNTRNPRYLDEARAALALAHQFDSQNEQILKELQYIQTLEQIAVSMTRRADWDQILEEWKRRQAAGQETRPVPSQ